MQHIFVYISHWNASLLYISIANSLGHNPENVICSKSTIFRARESSRKRKAESIKANFDPSEMCAIHWDGKAFHNRCGSKKYVCVVLSNSQKAKLLTVNSVPNGSANTTFDIVQSAVEEWDVRDCITSMCFDTEPLNTGRLNGVCLQFEAFIQKEILHLACRHHIYEIKLSGAFKSTIEPLSDSTSPDIQIFKRFAKTYG